MAKSTKAQEVATGTSDSYTEHEKADEHPPLKVTRAVLGGDHMPERVGGDSPSVGMDSSEFSENEQQSSEHEKILLPEHVRTTESPYDQTVTGDSTANSTDGNTPETETELSEESEEDTPAYVDWTYPQLQAECKERGLSAKGSTEDLVLRLMESDDASTEDDEDDDEFN